jgi:F-type H+-transporting ATPase subunit b
MTLKHMKTGLTVIIGAILAVVGQVISNMFVKTDMYHKMEEGGILVDPGQTISSIGVLLIMFTLVNLFFIAPLKESIQNRNNELETTFSEADSLRAEMATLKSDYEKRIADTEAQAREQIQAQIKEAQNLRATLMAEAQQKAADLLQKAQADIAAERKQVLTELRLQVVDLTMGATEKVLMENVDNEKNRKLVEEFVNKIEVHS